MRQARWYCPAVQESFSLLLHCLSSRLCGSLDEVERAVVVSGVDGHRGRGGGALRLEQGRAANARLAAPAAEWWGWSGKPYRDGH
jgi:hypothetical protein